MKILRMVIWTRIPLKTLINNIAFTQMWCTECIASIIFIFVKTWFYNKWQSLCLVRGSMKDLKKIVFPHSKAFTDMYFKSQKYTLGHLFVYCKNQLSEFIFKEIMQTRWFHIVNFWIHLQYNFIIVIWLIFIVFFYHFLFITETWPKTHSVLDQLCTDLERITQK